MSVTKEYFGRLADGREVSLFTIDTGRLCAKVTDLGAVLVSFMTPDRDGAAKDIVLGYDDVEHYLDNGPCLGATVGPNANRIAGASFEIDGQKYNVPANEGENNLHSDKMFYKRLFTAEEGDNSVTFTIGLPDGDAGFPGNRIFSVKYSLTEEELRIDYHATSDKKTIINLTNHSYFNLAGEDNGSIADQILQLNCSCFTKISGPFALFAVFSSFFTRRSTVYEKRILSFFLASSERRTRVMEVLTTVPGMQVYTANTTAETGGKGGRFYGPRCAYALETQFFPDNVHHENFPSAIFGPDREYESTTIYRFPSCR